MRRWEVWLGCGVVTLAAIGYGIVRSQRTQARAAARAQLEGDARSWFEHEGYESFFAEEGKPDLEPVRPLAPPFLPIAQRGSGDRFVYFGSDLAKRSNLPIAESLSNIGTVAISLETTSLYTMGALTYKATIVFVDARTRTVLARKSFWTDPPPGTVTFEYMSQWDDRFWAPVTAWIDQLPRL